MVRKRWSVRHVRNRKKISLVGIEVSIDAMGKGEILLMGRNRITLSLRFSKIIYVICLCSCVSVYSESSKQNHINKCSNKSYNKQTEDIINITNKQVNKCGVSMT